MDKAWRRIKEVSYFFEFIQLISMSYGPKNKKNESNLSKITKPVIAIKSLRFALFFKLIMACRLCCICVGKVMIPMYVLWVHGLYGLWCPRKAIIKLNHSFTPSLEIQYSSLEWCPRKAISSRISGLSWWRLQMETFSALLAICAGNSPVHGEFPAQRPVTRNFDVYFDMHPNYRLSKQSWGWWSLGKPTVISLI